MTTTQVILLVAMLAAVAVLIVRRGSPSVIQIERTRSDREKEIEDRDDA